MFPLARTPPPAGLYWHKATAYTLFHGYSRNKAQRGRRGAAKKLWGSPTEQTREEMLVVKVE